MRSAPPRTDRCVHSCSPSPPAGRPRPDRAASWEFATSRAARSARWRSTAAVCSASLASTSRWAAVTASRLCTACWDNSLSLDSASAAGSAITPPIDIDSTSTAAAEPYAVRRSEWRTRVIRLVTILRSGTDPGPACRVPDRLRTGIADVHSSVNVNAARPDPTTIEAAGRGRRSPVGVRKARCPSCPWSHRRRSGMAAPRRSPGRRPRAVAPRARAVDRDGHGGFREGARRELVATGDYYYLRAQIAHR